MASDGVGLRRSCRAISRMRASTCGGMCQRSFIVLSFRCNDGPLPGMHLPVQAFPSGHCKQCYPVAALRGKGNLKTSHSLSFSIPLTSFVQREREKNTADRKVPPSEGAKRPEWGRDLGW